MNIDLSKSGPSTEIIDILKVTTDAAKSRPDKRPINVPIDVTDLNKSFIVSRKLSAFLHMTITKQILHLIVFQELSAKKKFHLISTSPKMLSILLLF